MRNWGIVIPAVSILAGCTAYTEEVPDEEEAVEASSALVGTCPLNVAPTLLGTTQGTINDQSPTFYWTAVPGATSYTLVVLDVPSDHQEVHHSGADTFYTPGNPLPVSQDMRWKVKGESATCVPSAGPYSPNWYFRIEVPDDDPTGGGDGGDHNLECFPSFQACNAVCGGVCERRINCGGDNAHKCFE